MNSEQALEFLRQISEEYGSIREPKYRNANVDTLNIYLKKLNPLKPHLKDDKSYKNLLNGISQTIQHIRKISRESTWGNISDRGMNKAIHPVINKREHPVVFPFEWIDPKSGHSCFINDGYWDEKNFMAMDAVGYMLLLKEGEDKLPVNPSLIFDNIKSIKNMETDISRSAKNIIEPDILDQPVSEHFIRFNDTDFRKFTSTDLSSNQIFKLLYETSRVEFKLCFPIRLKDKKEETYQMNYYSRFFEFGHINMQVRKDGIIQHREYQCTFNTLLGKMFVHNLLSKNNDWIDNRFYMLPRTAQLFFRQFLIHNNQEKISFNLSTIKERLNLYNDNITNLINTIEQNALIPLVEQGLIISFKRNENGLNGTRYDLRIPKKGNVK